MFQFGNQTPLMEGCIYDFSCSRMIFLTLVCRMNNYESCSKGYDPRFPVLVGT